MTPSGRVRAPGLALLIGSALAFSSAGYFTRLVSLDAWTLLFWRGAFSGLFLLAVLVALHGSASVDKLRALGGAGLAVVATISISMMLYLHALRLTTVADVAVIYAATPVVTALLLWLRFGTRQTRVTLAASLMAVAGVAVMLGGAVGPHRWLGDLLAIAMDICTAVVMILVHRHPDRSMLAAACLGSFLTALAAWPLATPGEASLGQIGEMALFGVTQLGLGLLTLTLGTRLVPATESALIGTLDTPLSPIWVWLAFGEVPSWRTVLGGAVVLAGVLGHILLGRRPGAPPREA